MGSIRSEKDLLASVRHAVAMQWARNNMQPSYVGQIEAFHNQLDADRHLLRNRFNSMEHFLRCFPTIFLDTGNGWIINITALTKEEIERIEEERNAWIIANMQRYDPPPPRHHNGQYLGENERSRGSPHYSPSAPHYPKNAPKAIQNLFKMANHVYNNPYAYQLKDDELTFILKLIAAVKSNPCLYNSKNGQYRNSNFKNNVWDGIIQVLQFDGDIKALYARWKQLQDRYGKETRKSNNTNQPSTWQYYKHLNFLCPHMTDRTSQLRKESDAMEKQRLLQQSLAPDHNWTISLIEEVKSRCCLFDIREFKYRQTNCRNAAWKEVVATLDFPGDVYGISRQWKRLRDRFLREKRRIQEQKQIGIVYESSWDLFHSMSWMGPFVEERTMLRKRNHEDTFSDGEIDDIGVKSGIYADIMDKPVKGPDVLLDGDNAFAASVIADLRFLPEDVRAVAREHIKKLFKP